MLVETNVVGAEQPAPKEHPSAKSVLTSKLNPHFSARRTKSRYDIAQIDCYKTLEPSDEETRGTRALTRLVISRMPTGSPSWITM